MEAHETKVTKRIIKASFAATGAQGHQALDIPALATILVTSEDAAHPVDYIFSPQHEQKRQGWVAEAPGEQCLILDFDKPQTLRCISIVIHEEERARSQELTVSVSDDGGKTYRHLFRQEFNFSPPGTTCEKESWTVSENHVTHLCFWIKPDKGGGDAKARMTSVILQ